MSSGGHGKGGGRSRGGGHDDGGHDGPDERWLVSYSDMITVLMALFIVLFAISQVDQQKYEQLKEGLADSLGGADSSVPVDGGSGILEGSRDTAAPERAETVAASQLAPADAAMAAARAEVDRLDALEAQLTSALSGAGLADRVSFRVTRDGLVGAIVADDVFFEGSSAVLQPTGLKVIDTMAPVLRQATQELELQGHTNHLPVAGSLYPSNWELSAARAASVVRHLQDDGIAPRRMTAVGFADTRPLFAKTDKRAVAGNRRVDMVVESDQPAEVLDLLPEAEAQKEAGIAAPAPVEVAPAAATSTTTTSTTTTSTTTEDHGGDSH